MLSHLVIWQKQNARVNEYHHHTRSATICYVREGCDPLYTQWLGFIHVLDAKKLTKYESVKLPIQRIGKGENFVSTGFHEVPEGKWVQGCLVSAGVYAVVDTQVRIV